MVNEIICKRKALNCTASALSTQIGKSKFWLSNIESGKSKTVSECDIIKLFSILLNNTDEDFIKDYIGIFTKYSTSLNSKNWIHAIPLPDQIQELNSDEDFEHEFSFLIETLNDSYCDMMNLPIDQRRLFLAGLTNLNTNILLNINLTSLLMCIPLCRKDSLTTAESTSLNEELANLYITFESLALKKKRGIDISIQKELAKEKLALQKERANFIRDTLILKLHEWCSSDTVTTSYIKYNANYLETVLVEAVNRVYINAEHLFPSNITVENYQDSLFTFIKVFNAIFVPRFLDQEINIPTQHKQPKIIVDSTNN